MSQFDTPMANLSVFSAAVSAGFMLSTFAICYESIAGY